MMQKAENEFVEAQDSGLDEPIWHLNQGGARRGPMRWSEVKALAHQRNLHAGHQLWREGMRSWVSVADINELIGILKELPPEHTPSLRQDWLIWLLAVAPLIGEGIQVALADPPKTEPSKFWMVSLLLNLGLSEWDARRLKTRGVDLERHGLDKAWLIPVYLHHRAAALHHTSAYLLTWLVTFAISFFADLS